MHNVHTRNTVRYYVLIVAVLAFLFFSNDFGLTDVQKTQMVTGIKEDSEWLIRMVENLLSVTRLIAKTSSS